MIEFRQGFNFYSRLTPLDFLFSLQQFGLASVVTTGYYVALNQALVYPSLGVSAAIMLILFPYGFMIVGAVITPLNTVVSLVTGKPISIKFQNALRSLGFAFAISFSISITFLFVGTLARPEDTAPRMVQLLLSNVLFDGFTLLATVAILKLATRQINSLPLLLAIVIDIVAAAAFACSSLWFGLVGTSFEIEWSETWAILLGWSSASHKFHLGPLFWAMHTVFIPTGLYLIFLLMCWVAKSVTGIASWSLSVYSRQEVNPVALTAALIGLIVAIFGLISLGLRYIETHGLMQIVGNAIPRLTIAST
jgi:hypothetical protein